MSESKAWNFLLQVVMLALILIFAIVHSGLASLRDQGEKLVGERAFRVLFAGVSLPLAVSTVVGSFPLLFPFNSMKQMQCAWSNPYLDIYVWLIQVLWMHTHIDLFTLRSCIQVYFINHRYDGVQLWQLQSVPGLHQLVWLSSFISFFFLYPSTFNLLEVAAVDKPKMHLWETGIMRITRHPQVCLCSIISNESFHFLKTSGLIVVNLVASAWILWELELSLACYSTTSKFPKQKLAQCDIQFSLSPFLVSKLLTC